MVLWFHKNRHITLWTLINCSLRFVILDTTRKNRPQCFFHWKVCLSFQKVVFSTTPKVLKNALIGSTVNVRIPFGPLQIVLWCLSHSIIRENIGHNFFSLERLPFFFQKVVFSTTFMSYKNGLIGSTVNVRIPFGHL